MAHMFPHLGPHPPAPLWTSLLVFACFSLCVCVCVCVCGVDGEGWIPFLILTIRFSNPYDVHPSSALPLCVL